jgi:hypothetical protein
MRFTQEYSFLAFHSSQRPPDTGALGDLLIPFVGVFFLFLYLTAADRHGIALQE